MTRLALQAAPQATGAVKEIALAWGFRHMGHFARECRGLFGESPSTTLIGAWLEARAANDGGKIDERAMKELIRGWYLGEPTFAEKLRLLISPEEKKHSSRDPVCKSHDEAEAENLANQALVLMDLPQDRKALEGIRR